MSHHSGHQANVKTEGHAGKSPSEHKLILKSGKLVMDCYNGKTASIITLKAVELSFSPRVSTDSCFLVNGSKVCLAAIIPP